jgi:hypothetical protein
MAYAFVNAAVANGTSVTKTVVASGNLLIVQHSGGDGTNTPTISDTAGNTWTPATNSPSKDATNGSSISVWTAIANGTGSTTVTIGNAAASFRNTSIEEWSGNATSSVNDQGSGATNVAGQTGTDQMVGNSITPSVDNCLVKTWILDNAGTHDTTAIYAAGTGFTLRPTASYDPVINAASEANSASADVVQTTAAAVTAKWSCANFADHAQIFIASFKPFTGGGGGTATRTTNALPLVGVQ